MVNTQKPHNTPQQSVITQVRDAFRRMGWLNGIVVAVFSLRGIAWFWDWIRLFIGRGIGVDTPAMYGWVGDGLLGIMFSVLAMVLMGFGFNFSQLYPFRGLTISWALIIMGGGCQRWVSYCFDVSPGELALVVYPLYSAGALLFAAWFVWHYREAGNDEIADGETK